MKRLISVLAIIIFLPSCDPDVAGEGVNLPEMEFDLNLNPHSAYLQLGDTITLSTTISNILSNGVHIDDGKATIDLYMGYTQQIPITTFGFETVEVGNHVNLLEKKGEIRIYESTNSIVEVYVLPYGDSLKLEVAFIPLKIGTYSFQVQSKFYEGSKGKTRTLPKFNMPNHHFDTLWKVEGDNYQPGNIGYDSRYLFAVTE